MYTPVNPSFTIYKWGLRGSKLYRRVFVMSGRTFSLTIPNRLNMTLRPFMSTCVKRRGPVQPPQCHNSMFPFFSRNIVPFFSHCFLFVCFLLLLFCCWFVVVVVVVIVLFVCLLLLFFWGGGGGGGGFWGFFCCFFFLNLCGVANSADPDHGS